MADQRCPDRSSGFTLVELLVSLVVLALIALTMTSALRFVIRAVASTDQRREQLEELTLGLSFLRGELQRTEPMMRKVEGRQLVMFAGGSDRLRFVNVEPPYLAGSPYTAFEIAIEPDAGAWRIAVRRAALDPAEPDLAVVETVEPRTVLRLTRPVQFSFWGRERPREPPAWHEQWPIGAFLPDAVRLAGAVEPGWPELVVPLRITAPWYCAAGGAAGGGQGGESARVGGATAGSQGDKTEKAVGAAGGSQGGGNDRAGCPTEEETGAAGRREGSEAGETGLPGTETAPAPEPFGKTN